MHRRSYVDATWQRNKMMVCHHRSVATHGWDIVAGGHDVAAIHATCDVATRAVVLAYDMVVAWFTGEEEMR